jgi:hypothetical protein
MSKQKAKIYIAPYGVSSSNPINLTELSEFFDIIASKFEIVSIEIQINEYKKPSEFYFELLSGLCKTITKSVIVDNYTGTKKNNIFKVDSFSLMNIIVDNSEKPFTIIYENDKKQFKSLDDLAIILSVL